MTVITAAGCGAGGGITLTASHRGHAYRDAAGWTIDIPPGWHVVRFSDSTDGITSAGVQLSNVRLPPPALVPGFPIQVNGGVLPAHGVGLVIATDTDPRLSRGPVAVPPLPARSAPKTLWFRIHSTTLIACAKIGPKATSHDLKAVDTIIKSLR
jgi:hypothetical protein